MTNISDVDKKEVTYRWTPNSFMHILREIVELQKMGAIDRGNDPNFVELTDVYVAMRGLCRPTLPERPAGTCFLMLYNLLKDKQHIVLIDPDKQIVRATEHKPEAWEAEELYYSKALLFETPINSAEDDNKPRPDLSETLKSDIKPIVLTQRQLRILKNYSDATTSSQVAGNSGMKLSLVKADTMSLIEYELVKRHPQDINGEVAYIITDKAAEYIKN